MPVTVSARAAQELKDLLKSENKESAALRVWVAGGGCSGLSYGIALDENDPEEGDEQFESEGIKILVDGLSLQYMDGSCVDYVDDSMGGGFKVDNPNAVSTCGCGSSFQTEEGQASGGCGSCGCGSR